MSWHDSLTWADTSNQQRKKASFRGANFFVIDTGTSFGRRNIVHQYPKKDTPFVEDIGLDTDEFTIEGYVIQNSDNDQNYFDERNALIEALRAEGPGQLWHPFLGILTVSLVGRVNMRENFREGGIARFSMPFIRTEEEGAPFPKEVIDHVEAVDKAVESSLFDGVDGLGSIYIGEDQPDFTLNSIFNSVGEFNKMMRSAMSSIQGLGPAQLSRALTILSEEYLGIDLDVINDACALGNSVIGMFNGFLSLSGMFGDILIEQLFGPCSTLVRGITSGPWSGAQTKIPKTGGFAGSTISDPAIVAEDFGKTSVQAALAINQFGEATGNDNPSQYGGTLETVTITTVSNAQLSANQESLINIVRLVALTTAARTAIRIDYTSQNSVIDIMDQVLDAIDVQLLKLGDDVANTAYDTFGIKVSDPDNYQALRSLRPVFVKSMLGVGASLAKIIDFEVPPATLSSLALSYSKYEDLDRESEIITRNIPLVKNPGFLPGGQTLEILNV